MIVPVVPLVQAPSVWILFAPPIVLSAIAGYFMAKAESRPARVGGSRAAADPIAEPAAEPVAHARAA
jgi:hypothetical protein